MRAPTPEKTPTGVGERTSAPFTVSLENFEGPFDLLLSLISRRKLDITEIALAEVTDEFLTYIRALFEADTPQALDKASEFLVTAATLLDLKAARLLPQTKADSSDQVALLEARDLLFARLLQYRAYSEVADLLQTRYSTEAQRFPRTVALEPQFRQVLPELVFETSPEEFARIAAQALSATAPLQDQPHPAEEVDPRPQLTTIAAEEKFIRQYLVGKEEITYTDLIAGCGQFEIAVYRFLALLEMMRAGSLDAVQESPHDPIKVKKLDSFQPEQGLSETKEMEREGGVRDD